MAWVDHQRGVRALCLYDLGRATSLLGAALALREVLGDARGAERSAQALRRARELGGAAPVPSTYAPSRGAGRAAGRPPRPGRLAWPMMALAATGLGVVTGFVIGDAGSDRGTSAAGPSRTVTGPDRMVTVVRTVTEPARGGTIPAAGRTVTTTAPGETTTVTVPRKADTVTTTQTVTETDTVTQIDTVTTTVFTTTPGPP